MRGCRCVSWLTFNFGSVEMCSPAIFETYFSYDKNIWMVATDNYMHFYIVVLSSIDSYSAIEKFYSFILVHFYIVILSSIDSYSPIKKFYSFILVY